MSQGVVGGHGLICKKSRAVRFFFLLQIKGRTGARMAGHRALVSFLLVVTCLATLVSTEQDPMVKLEVHSLFAIPNLLYAANNTVRMSQDVDPPLSERGLGGNTGENKSEELGESGSLRRGASIRMFNGLIRPMGNGEAQVSDSLGETIRPVTAMNDAIQGLEHRLIKSGVSKFLQSRTYTMRFLISC